MEGRTCIRVSWLGLDDVLQGLGELRLVVFGVLDCGWADGLLTGLQTSSRIRLLRGQRLLGDGSRHGEYGG